MAINLTQIMFKYEKRMAMRKTLTYKQLLDIWKKSELSSTSNVGDCDYIVRNYMESNKNITRIDRQSWAKYYLLTGDNRKKSMEKESTYYDLQKDKYYGRTLDNLYNIANKFIKLAQENNIKIDIAGALNFVYCAVVDETYLKYANIFNIIETLEKENPSLRFCLSDPCTYNSQDIDLFGENKETGELSLGLKLVTDKSSIDDITRQKDNIFESIYSCTVSYLTIDNDYNLASNNIVF